VARAPGDVSRVAADTLVLLDRILIERVAACGPVRQDERGARCVPACELRRRDGRGSSLRLSDRDMQGRDDRIDEGAVGVPALGHARTSPHVTRQLVRGCLARVGRSPGQASRYDRVAASGPPATSPPPCAHAACRLRRRKVQKPTFQGCRASSVIGAIDGGRVLRPCGIGCRPLDALTLGCAVCVVGASSIQAMIVSRSARNCARCFAFQKFSSPLVSFASPQFRRDRK